MAGSKRVHLDNVVLTARVLNGYTPASMEALIVELATPAAARTLPPGGAAAPPEMSPALLRRYGMDVLPGPARCARTRDGPAPTAGPADRS